MRLTMGHLGDWIVDPHELAERLGVSDAYLKRSERRGLVDSRIKAGEGEAEGLTRVTVRLHDKGWRGLFDGHGLLISEERW